MEMLFCYKKMASFRVLLSSINGRHISEPFTSIRQKNIFLHGDLIEDIYMEKTIGFVAQEVLGLISMHKYHFRFDLSYSTLS
jgi:glycerol-3-phosphate responsive antiterminator